MGAHRYSLGPCQDAVSEAGGSQSLSQERNVVSPEGRSCTCSHRGCLQAVRGELPRPLQKIRKHSKFLHLPLVMLWLEKEGLIGHFSQGCSPAHHPLWTQPNFFQWKCHAFWRTKSSPLHLISELLSGKFMLIHHGPLGSSGLGPFFNMTDPI